MDTSTRRKPPTFHVLTCGRLRKDGSAATIRTVTNHATAADIDLGVDLAAVAAEARTVQSQTPGIGSFNDERAMRHERDAIRAKAGRLRVAALRSIDSAFEDRARDQVTQLLETKAKLKLPDDVTDLETAAGHGGKTVDVWLESEAIDARVLATHQLLDSLRRVTILEPTYPFGDKPRRETNDQMRFILSLRYVPPSAGTGWLVSTAHRYADLANLTQPGCYNAEEARNNLAQFEKLLITQNRQPTPKRRPGGMWGE